VNNGFVGRSEELNSHISTSKLELVDDDRGGYYEQEKAFVL